MKTAVTILVTLLVLAGCRGNGDPAPAPASEASPPPRPGAAEPATGDATGRMKLYYDLDRYTNQWMTARAEGKSVTWSSLESSLLTPLANEHQTDLIRTLGNPEEGRLRVIAARAIGFGSAADRIVPALMAVLGEKDPNLVSSALVSLYVQADPLTPLAPLAELLSHPDADVRVNDSLALYAVLRARSRGGKVPLTDEVKTTSGRLLALVSTAGEDAAPSALSLAEVILLGEIGDPMATDVLLNLLGDTAAIVRTRAAEGLGQLGREQAIPPLIDALGRARAPMEKQVIAAALAEIARKENLPVDAKVLGTDPSNWRAWYMAVKRPDAE